MKRLLCGLVLVLVLVLMQSACSSPPLPEDHYYRLDVAPPTTRDLSVDVTVQTVTASGIYNERPLLYSTAQAPTELRQYHYQYWADAPARMIREQLGAYLRAAQSATRGATSACQVSGRVQRFEQHLAGRNTTAIAAIELALRCGATDRLVLRKTYRAEARTADSSPLAAAEGLDRALGACFAEFVSDLRRVK